MAASTASTLGEANTSPQTAAVSMPAPTKPAWAGSCPAPPPDTSAKRSAPSTDARELLQKKKLGYKDQRELDALPARIEALEAEQADIRARLADGALYQADLQAAIALQARDGAIEDELMHALERWEQLGSA